MTQETLASTLSSEIAVMLLVTGLSLLAVSYPFYRGLTIALSALAATRRLGAAEIERGLRHAGAVQARSVTLQMLRVLRKSLRESSRESFPTDFVVDASRQYVSHDYDAHFARPLSMCANILPPIGFIGTTGGLLVLFVSMHVASESLELGALAMALTSSIFALVGFSILEGLKFRLYRRLLDRLDDAVSFFRSTASAPAPRSPLGARAEASPGAA